MKRIVIVIAFAVVIAVTSTAHAQFGKGGKKAPSIGDVIQAHNEYRLIETSEDGIYRATLTENAKLTAAAQYWADYMKRHKFFGHFHNGIGPSDRAVMFEYGGRVSENLARLDGGQNPADAFARRPATGHYANMTSPTWSEIGVGVVSFRGDKLWVLMYGRPGN